MANPRFGLSGFYATINLPASSACSDSVENSADAKAPPCFKFRDRLQRSSSEIVDNSKIKATWCVVPVSGTGDPSGLRREGGLEGDFRKGSEGWLDCWFE
jgi:hypothetical protein